jgi:hypothetical protein
MFFNLAQAQTLPSASGCGKAEHRRLSETRDCSSTRLTRERDDGIAHCLYESTFAGCASMEASDQRQIAPPCPVRLVTDPFARRTPSHHHRHGHEPVRLDVLELHELLLGTSLSFAKMSSCQNPFAISSIPKLEKRGPHSLSWLRSNNITSSLKGWPREFWRTTSTCGMRIQRWMIGFKKLCASRSRRMLESRP